MKMIFAALGTVLLLGVLSDPELGARPLARPIAGIFFRKKGKKRGLIKKLA